MPHPLFFHPKLILRRPSSPQKNTISEAELLGVFDNPDLLIAIKLAAPAFYDELLKLKNGQITKVKKRQHLLRTLYKYMWRNSHRSTPFGLFAGCSVAQWNSKNQLIIQEKVEQKIRVNIHFLHLLAKKIETFRAIREQLTYRLNSSLYQKQQKGIYIQYHEQGHQLLPALNAVDLDEFLAHVFQFLESPRSFKKIINTLIQFDASITTTEATAYLHQLIDAQIIISKLSPAVSDENYLTTLQQLITAQTQPSEPLAAIGLMLEELGNKVQAFKQNRATSLEVPITVKTLEKLGVQWDKRQIFVIDVFFGNEKPIALQKKHQKEILQALQALATLFPQKTNTKLADFIDQFHHKYGGQEVPLLEAMDPQRGLGFPVKKHPITRQSTQKQEFSLINQRLLKWGIAAQQNKRTIIDLAKEDLGALVNLSNNFPTVFLTKFSLHQKNETEVDLFLKVPAAFPAQLLMSRFTLNQPVIKAIAKELAQFEQSQYEAHTILAEVVHLPAFDTRSLMQRSSFHQYEIPYLANSNLPEAQQVPLSDLMVSVDIWQNKLILRSKKWNKRVLPRQSTAFNFRKSQHPIFLFLCQLQYQQNSGGLQFDWGALERRLDFLPRVCYKNIILSKARWRLNKLAITELLALKEGDWKVWQKKWRLPTKFELLTPEAAFYINLADVYSRTILLDFVKNKENIFLQEYLYAANTSPLKNEQGATYAQEWIAFVQNRRLKSDAWQPLSEAKIATQVHPISRRFPPGSEWLYYKIYCTEAIADVILLRGIFPFVLSTLNQKIIDQWFFIRYDELGHHLRVRFHFRDLGKLGDFMVRFQQILAPFLAEGLIQKLQTDTYERELERFGPANIKTCETLFFLDSMSVLTMLKHRQENSRRLLKWHFALWFANILLSKLDVTDATKLAWLEGSFDTIKAVQQVPNIVKDKNWSKEYRELRKEIKLLLTNEHASCLSFKESIAETSQPTFLLLNKLTNTTTPKAFFSLLTIFVHLHINRLFAANTLIMELRIYYYLIQVYRSEVAKQKPLNL